MSKRRIHLMRALVEGILAALGLLALGSLHAVAEAPGNGPNNTPGVAQPAQHLNLLPFEQGLEDRLVLLHGPAPALSPAAPPQVVVLPNRAPLAQPPASTPAPWRPDLDPARLWHAMNAALAAPLLAPAVVHAAPAAAGERTFGRAAEIPAPAAPAAATAARPAAAAPASPAAGLSEPLASTADLTLETHHSLLVQSPVPLKRVSITDDSIAQAVVVSPTQVLVQGRAPGEVSLLLWDADSNARAYTVQVGLDPAPLQREMNRLFPTARLDVTASGEALVLSGVLPNAASAKQALAVAAGFSKNVVNNLSVDQAGDPEQVLLQVRFAEVDRSAVTELGANLISTGALNTTGSLTTGQFSPPASVVTPENATNSVSGSSVVAGGSKSGLASAAFGLNDLLNVFLFNKQANLGLLLKALQQKDVLQILAEPNLIAMDGKDASFLAGGEFPFPVVQGQGAVNNVTIQFKPFGVNLHFKPTILPDGTIDLQVAPEVSALDFSNALTVSGFLIPALSTRRAETELELADGQSFVIAGLMDNRLTDNISKLPGLSQIPILGKFFESRSLSKSRNELMVVVTAHLVHPTNAAAKGPKMAEPFLLPDKFDGKSPKGE